MAVRLTELRVTANMDVDQYVAAMAKKVASDRAGAASSEAVGAALAKQDADAEKVAGSVTKMSRTYVAGYADASRFQKAIEDIGRAMGNAGVSMDRAAVLSASLYNRFKQTADVTDLKKKGFHDLAAVIDALNSKYAAMAEVERRATAAAEAHTRVVTAQAQISRSVGINERYAGGTAAASASVFQEQFSREAAERAAMRRAQDSRYFGEDLSSRFRIGAAPKSARESAGVFEDVEREKAALAIRAEQIVKTHLLVEAEHKRTAAIRAEINALIEAKALTKEQASEAIRVEELRSQRTLNAIAGMHEFKAKSGTGTGLARHEAINLSRQIQDIGVSLASGQSPLTVLIQQGTQVFDIFSASEASAKGFFSQTISWAGRAATSVAGITTGVVALGAGVALIGYNWSESQRDIERATAGIGRASGATVASINHIAEASAAAAKVSVASAREILSAFAATGQIDSSNFGGLLGVTKGYSRQFGLSEKDAASELAKAFSDPLKGADELNAKLGFLDAKTRAYIRTLTESGDRTGAQRALLDAMSSSVSGAADRVSVLTRAWEALSRAASNAVDSVGNAAAGQRTLEQRMADAMQRSETYDRMPSISPRRKAEARAEAERLQREIYAKSAEDAAKAGRVASAQNSLRVQGIVDSLTPFDTEIAKAKNELADLQRFLSDPKNGQFTEDMGRATRALDALGQMVTTALSPLERMRRSGEAAVQAIHARTAAQREAAEITRLEIDLAGQRVTAEERQIAVVSKLNELRAAANREVRDALRSANDNLALSGLLPYERAMKEAEIRNRDLRARTVTPAASDTYGPSPAPAVGADRSLMSYARGGVNTSDLDAGFAAKLKILLAGIDGIKITSGFRDEEHNARVGGVPNSRHTHGLAADMIGPDASLDEVRRRAAALGLRVIPSNNGAIHVDAGLGAARGRLSADRMGTGTGDTETGVKAVLSAEQEAIRRSQIGQVIRVSNLDLAAQNKILDAQIETYGRSTYEITKAAKAKEIENGFISQGVPITASLRAEIEKLAEGYGTLAQRQATVRLQQDVAFERQQIGRTPEEQAIESRLRPYGGSAQNEAIAEQMRLNQQLELTKGLAGDALKGFISDLRAGKSGAEALSNQLNRIADKLLDMAINKAISGLFSGGGQGGGFSLSGLFSGFGGGAGAPVNLLPTGGLYANGGAFYGGNVVPFARGGAFTNSIVSAPTMFPFAKGIGLMGEAGPEAIMPLRRDSNGRLGVASAGPGAAANMNVQIINQNGSEVSVKKVDGPKGPSLQVMIAEAVNSHLASGKADRVMGRRYGAGTMG